MWSSFFIFMWFTACLLYLSWLALLCCVNTVFAVDLVAHVSPQFLRLRHNIIKSKDSLDYFCELVSGNNKRNVCLLLNHSCSLLVLSQVLYFAFVFPVNLESWLLSGQCVGEALSSLCLVLPFSSITCPHESSTCHCPT